MKRSRVKPVSDKRHKENIERRKMMMDVRYRDVDCQAKGVIPAPCHGPLNGHELRKTSAGGSRVDPDNVILLCDFHNGWCENHPIEAWCLGFVIRRTRPPGVREDFTPPDRRPSARI
jgi:hypothetical protein